MSRWSSLALVFGLACTDTAPLAMEHLDNDDDVSVQAVDRDDAGDAFDEVDAYDYDEVEFEGRSPEDYETAGSSDEPLCAGDIISEYGVEQVVRLTEVSDHEDVYSTYARIDGIASVFEACGDPWGMFPTTYRRITARGVQALEDGEFEDPAWARRIIVDFAGRYMHNVREAVTGGKPSWAWSHYYMLADREDVSRTRSVVVAMVAHLTLDLPHSLVAIDSQAENEDDFFVFGEMMIEVSDLLIDDLRVHYDTDAEDLLNGFFFGDWVDGAFGEETMITVSYQTIRTKAWNGMWLLGSPWTAWVAEGEIYAAFWTIDGVLATLDASGII